jgi:hypothetical protein
MKFIHSSDLQVGKAFGYFHPETASILQDARQAVVRTLGDAPLPKPAKLAHDDTSSVAKVTLKSV